MKIPEELMELIDGGESLTVEFKECSSGIKEDVYQTVCSLSNRDGGHIILGVKDNREITGIEKDRVEQLRERFVRSVRDILYPPLSLNPYSFEVRGKQIIHIPVPASWDVIFCSGRIWNRYGNMDFDITRNSWEVYRLYARKLGDVFVNHVTSVGPDSLRGDLLCRARDMSVSRRMDHPWKSMSDEAMLRSVGLIRRDEDRLVEGVTYAGILLFGKDDTILSVFPRHKTDALFRAAAPERFDDRDVVITNLFESYDRLMFFGKRHLKGILPESAGDQILHEIIANSLAHRDYSSARGASVLIERDRMIVENASIPHGYGLLNPESLESFSKNPPISRVFRETGLARELGSGLRNTCRFTRMYSNVDPTFIEGDVFRTVIPLS